jgi:hypothetical protein
VTIADLYKEAEKLINEFIRVEMKAQGHHLTGAMEESLGSETSSTGKAELMEGFAVYYAKIVNDGFPAKSASFKQFPFLVEFFVKKGFPIYSSSGGLTANQLAAMTIRKWMKEGMPTAASNRFSSVTRRQRMFENAFQDNKQKLDEFMSNGFDFIMEEDFQKEKSETI